MSDAATILTGGAAAVTEDQGAGAAANTGTATQADKGNGSGAPWYAGKLEGELLGWVQNKGVKLDEAGAAVSALAHSYRELEKRFHGMHGAQPDQVVKWPKDAGDEAAWKAVWSKLGVPEKADDYKFDGLKHADGNDVDAAYVDHVRSIASKFKLTAEQAAGVAKEHLSFLEKIDADETAANKARDAAALQELDRSWGGAKDANMHMAKQAAASIAKAMGPNLGPKLGQAIEALQQQGGVGFVAAMEMFATLGRMLGEDKFVTGNNPAGSGTMTKEQASARLSELKADKGWQAKYFAKDADAVREFRALTALITGHSWPTHQMV